jgi:hypothetical protein
MGARCLVCELAFCFMGSSMNADGLSGLIRKSLKTQAINHLLQVGPVADPLRGGFIHAILLG